MEEPKYFPNWEDVEYSQYRLHPTDLSEESLELHYINSGQIRRINAKTGEENDMSDIPGQAVQGDFPQLGEPDMTSPSDFPQPGGPDMGVSPQGTPPLGGPAEPDRTIMTESYLIQYQPGESGTVQIYARPEVPVADVEDDQTPPPVPTAGSDAVLLREFSDKGSFISAAQLDEHLILTFITTAAGQQSYLLNKNNI